MNITGLIVYAQPAHCQALRAALTEIPGVELHAATPEGRMVVTVECSTDEEMTRIFDRVGGLAGVVSTALVYHHDEEIDE